MKKKYTIKDIAQMSGVSKGTVDRVLHNRGKVSDKALNAINAVLKNIDYEPNILARNLKNNKIYHICVLFPDPNEDNYWLPCLEGVKDAITEFKHLGVYIETYFYNPNSTNSFIEKSTSVFNLKPDGVLFAPLFYKETIQVLNRSNLKNILLSTFNHEVKSKIVNSFVGQDLFKSGRVAANLMHSIINKNSNILIIHIDESFNNAIHMQKKESGFRNYFEDLKNYNIATLKIRNDSFSQSEFSEYIKNHNVSGIFVTTSKAYMIAQLINETASKGIKIIGYDLLEENKIFLKKGKIEFLINQNPKAQAFIGISNIIEYFIFNKKISSNKLLPIDIVNSENLETYLND